MSAEANQMRSNELRTAANQERQYQTRKKEFQKEIQQERYIDRGFSL